MKRPFSIDTHAHILLPELPALMQKHITRAQNDARSWEGGKVTERHFDRKLRLKDMNRGKIDMQVISTGLPAACQWTERDGARALMRAVNEGVAAWVAVAPERFVGIGTVLLHDVDLAIEELDYAVNALGLRGLMSLTNIRGHDLGEQQFWPFWQALEKTGVPIFLHPQGFTQPDRLLKFNLGNTIGQPLEHALAMASLIHEGVLERFPKLKVHFAHGGGYLPFYSGRSDSTYARDPDQRERDQAQAELVHEALLVRHGDLRPEDDRVPGRPRRRDQGDDGQRLPVATVGRVRPRRDVQEALAPGEGADPLQERGGALWDQGLSEPSSFNRGGAMEYRAPSRHPASVDRSSRA